MAAPTSYPVWMTNPPNQDMLVGDVNAYNAAVAQGYTFGMTTPMTTITNGAVPAFTQATAQVPINAAQPESLADLLANLS